MAQSQKNSNQSPLSLTVNELFSRSYTTWDDIPDQVKEGSAFMINRLLSKQYPQICELLNSKGLDPVVVTEIWKTKLTGTGRTPYWFWKRPKKEKLDEDNVDEWIERTFYPDHKEEEIEYGEIKLKKSRKKRK